MYLNIDDSCCSMKLRWSLMVTVLLSVKSMGEKFKWNLENCSLTASDIFDPICDIKHK